MNFVEKCRVESSAYEWKGSEKQLRRSFIETGEVIIQNPEEHHC